MVVCCRHSTQVKVLFEPPGYSTDPRLRCRPICLSNDQHSFAFHGEPPQPAPAFITLPSWSCHSDARFPFYRLSFPCFYRYHIIRCCSKIHHGGIRALRSRRCGVSTLRELQTKSHRGSTAYIYHSGSLLHTRVFTPFSEHDFCFRIRHRCGSNHPVGGAAPPICHLHVIIQENMRKHNFEFGCCKESARAG